MTNVVGVVRPRYVVQTGEAYKDSMQDFANTPQTEVAYIDWEFVAAFDVPKEAEQYAAKIARNVEYVRVIDRGED